MALAAGLVHIEPAPTAAPARPAKTGSARPEVEEHETAPAGRKPSATYPPIHPLVNTPQEHARAAIDSSPAPAPGAGGPGSIAAAFDRAKAKGSLRVLYAGTSITCGKGASSPHKSYFRLTDRGLEDWLKVKVESSNPCYGGAHSLTLLAQLKQMSMGFKPDLAIVELGVLDDYMPEFSQGAIESIMRYLLEKRVAAIYVLPASGESGSKSRGPYRQLAARYGVPLADMEAYVSARLLWLSRVTTDNCHPNDLGHKLISEALIGRLGSARSWTPPAALPERVAAVNFDRAAFHAASKALVLKAARPVKLIYFASEGGALEARDEAEIEIRFEGSFVALLFRTGAAAEGVEYRVDAGEWRPARSFPEWYINRFLVAGLAAGPHTMGLRLRPGKSPAILDGFLFER